jgi:hypothetical protein
MQGNVWRIEVLEKITLAPILGLISCKIVKDTSVTAGLVEHDIGFSVGNRG